MAAVDAQKVLEVRHWTDSLFSFKTTRDAGFRFENGQFVMVGLEIDGRPLMRAYSMASANYEDILEFFSIRVANGPLTSRLGHINAGDEVLVGKKPTGTLLQDNLLPGRRLYLFATGTGIAPFVSIMKDPQVYERFETLVLVHGCRYVKELAFGEQAVESLRNDEYLAEMVEGRLLYYPTVTREPFAYRGRVTELISSGRLATDLNLPQFDRDDDRAMICGSPAMLKDMCALMHRMGFEEGSGSNPAHYVIEKAFVER